MELKQLRSFAAVVDCLSFTRAAERTYTSQPTISAHIRALEEELGTRLIVRDTKHIEITPKGRELYACAARMLELERGLIERWRDDKKTFIRIGASTIPSAYILPDVLPRYGKLHQDVCFTVHQSDSAGVIEGMRGGLFDVGLVGMPCEDTLFCCEPFCRDRIVLIAPASERFLALRDAGASALDLLRREPVVLRETGSGSRMNADQFLQAHAIREDALTVAARINDQEAIKNLVAGGLGVSLVSEKAVQDYVRQKRLLQFPLPGEAAERSLYLLYRRETAARGAGEHAVSRFIDYVRCSYRTQRAEEPI